MASQSAREEGEATGDVSSMYSTPNSERAVALRKDHTISQTRAGQSWTPGTVSHLDLGFGVKEGIGELLTLAEGALDDLETVRVGEEVADSLVGRTGVVAAAVAVGVGAIDAVGGRGFGFGAHGKRIGRREIRFGREKQWFGRGLGRRRLVLL